AICDIAALLRNGNLDWDDLLAEARCTRSWRVVAVGLELAAGLFRAPVPPPVWHQVKQDRRAAALATQLASKFRRDEMISEETPGGALLHLRMIAGPAGKLRYLWHRTVRPKQTDVNFIQLPQSLSAGYYVLRPFRIMGATLARLHR